MIIKRWEEGNLERQVLVEGQSTLVRKEELGIRDLEHIVMTIINDNMLYM